MSFLRKEAISLHAPEYTGRLRFGKGGMIYSGNKKIKSTYQPDRIRPVARSFKKKTAIGIDLWELVAIALRQDCVLES